MMFVEDINFKAWAKGLFGKHTLDAGFGQFFNILSYICWKRDVYFLKVDKDYTSQICPNCIPKQAKRIYQIEFIIVLIVGIKQIVMWRRVK